MKVLTTALLLALAVVLGAADGQALAGDPAGGTQIGWERAR
jgi:hypothetical protein